MKKTYWLIVGLLIVSVLAGIYFYPRETGYLKEPYVKEEVLFDTFVKIIAYGRDKSKVEKAVGKAMDKMREIDREMNFHNPQSQVSLINQKAAQEKVSVSPGVIEVLGLGKKYYGDTGGAFDMTIGPVIELWGFKTTEHVPAQAELKSLLSKVDSSLVSIDSQKGTVHLLEAGVKVDLGGIAKGYAADKAIEILQEEGITQALVSTQSATRILQAKPSGEKWRVGIESPRKSKEKIIGVVNLTDKSVSTSGDYQYYFIRNNRRYHHILNPKTGWPTYDCLSTTVITNRDCADADILSTAIFVMGWPKGMKYVEAQPDLEAVVVTPDGQVHLSSGLRGKVEDLVEKL